MAYIQERKKDDGKTHYRAQIRLKGYPTTTATFERKTDAKQWAQQTEAAMREGRYFKTSESKKHKEWGWLDDSPMRKVTKPTEPRGRVRFLSDSERTALLKACQESSNPYLYLAFVLAISTGLRQGELRNTQMTKQKDVEQAKESPKQALLSPSDSKKEIAEKSEKIKELEEKIRLNNQAMMPGKCPVRVLEEKGEINWKFSVYKEPYHSLTGVLKHLTATTDFELAAEIFDKGRNALPGKGHAAHNANLALQSLADRAPKDAIEARLCLQATALYSQGMQYLSKAENAAMLCHSEFYMKCAIKLLRLHNETIEAISKQHRGGEQRVVVQYVNVNDGGRAIVGNMLTGGGGDQNK